MNTDMYVFGHGLCCESFRKMVMYKKILYMISGQISNGTGKVIAILCLVKDVCRAVYLLLCYLSQKVISP